MCIVCYLTEEIVSVQILSAAVNISRTDTCLARQLLALPPCGAFPFETPILRLVSNVLGRVHKTGLLTVDHA